MPINSRYTTGAFRTTSSLFKSAKSAANKVQVAEDNYNKYLWQNNLMTNDEYLSYAQKRASQYNINDTAQMTDAIQWLSTVKSVNKEISSDYRANKMLELSTMQDGSPDVFTLKKNMYEQLYQNAYENNDLDSMVTIQTQYNNMIDANAKAGIAAANKLATRNYNMDKNAIDLARINVKQAKNPDGTPVDEISKMAALAMLDSKEIQIKYNRLQNITDESAAGNLIESITKLQESVANRGKYFNATILDQNGNVYDPTRQDYTPIITSYSPKMETDIFGGQTPSILTGTDGQPAFSRYWDGTKMNLVDYNTGDVVSATTDAFGNATFTTGNEKLSMGKDVTRLLDKSGNPYYVKIQRKSYPNDNMLPTGEYGKEAGTTTPPDYAEVVDIYGNKLTRNVNAATYNQQHEGETGFTPMPEFTVAAPHSLTTNAAADMARAESMIAASKSGGNPQDRVKMLKEGETLLSQSRKAYEAESAALAQKSAEAMAKTNAALKLTTPESQYTKVNPFTMQYELPKATSGPVKIPQPSIIEQQHATSIGPSGGFMAPIVGGSNAIKIGSTAGVNYYKIPKSDGGYDFIKGNPTTGFKLSKQDAEKELKMSIL